MTAVASWPAWRKAPFFSVRAARTSSPTPSLRMQAHPKYDDAMTVSAQTDDFWDDDDEWISYLRPYNVKDGILTIPVHGVLMNRLSITWAGWVTGYQYIERAVERGLEDPEVRGIAFDIDSPGGEVSGNFQLVERIAAQRGVKPMIAFANDHAYSAAYSIATASDEIVLSRSGGVGSVGVVTMHIDVSEALGKQGVKVTFIYAGKHKVDGNPYEQLPDAVKDRIQERIDRVYGEFVSLVAANRDMEEDAVRATEALTYDASNAVEVGFADRIGAMDEEMAAFSQQAQMETEQMALTTQKNSAAAPESGTFTQEQMDAAVATARQEGMEAGAVAERERTSAILDSEEAKKRPTAARALADSGMDAATAKAALAKMPEEVAAEAPKKEEATTSPAPTPFAAVMEGTGPQVGADVTGPEGHRESWCRRSAGGFCHADGPRSSSEESIVAGEPAQPFNSRRNDMAVDNKVPYGSPGEAGFEKESWGNRQNWQFGDTPALTTKYITVTATGADRVIAFLDVLNTTGGAAAQDGATPALKANYIAAAGVTIPDGSTASVPVYVQGHFDMDALGWAATYDTDAKKEAAFQGSISPTIFVSKSKHNSDAIYP
ncbi:peptidase S49 [Synechococcus virus S-ESS1]|uniref:Peptidase S49 n=1 Tax=Synechococcus virus S-ESS1 TaxID=1964565 RepID=A0A1V0DX33_9CAUD|nr:head maturation protease [Synechococcus virus S-ESS1]ARB05713.1 peptidase S49 [Synechococcus virus S-ESS1]